MLALASAPWMLAGCGDDSSTDAGSTPDAPPVRVNGCTEGSAMDMRGMAAVTITDISAWMTPHSACIIVDAGTSVTWNGSFGPHPLVGGETGTPDTASPITLAGPGAGTTPVTATFASAGVFPYYCTIHLDSMQGVVYVR